MYEVSKRLSAGLFSYLLDLIWSLFSLKSRCPGKMKLFKLHYTQVTLSMSSLDAVDPFPVRRDRRGKMSSWKNRFSDFFWCGLSTWNGLFVNGFFDNGVGSMGSWYTGRHSTHSYFVWCGLGDTTSTDRITVDDELIEGLTPSSVRAPKAHEGVDHFKEKYAEKLRAFR